MSSLAGLSIQNLPRTRAGLMFQPGSASVSLLTELQNSSSVSCFEASLQRAAVSSSSGAPAKPGTVRCSMAVKAALDNLLRRICRHRGRRHSSKPALLLRREMNRHCRCCSVVLVIFRVGEKMTSGKTNGASGWRTARLGGAIYLMIARSNRTAP